MEPLFCFRLRNVRGNPTHALALAGRKVLLPVNDTSRKGSIIAQAYDVRGGGRLENYKQPVGGAISRTTLFHIDALTFGCVLQTGATGLLCFWKYGAVRPERIFVLPSVDKLTLIWKTASHFVFAALKNFVQVQDQECSFAFFGWSQDSSMAVQDRSPWGNTFLFRSGGSRMAGTLIEQQPNNCATHIVSFVPPSASTAEIGVEKVCWDNAGGKLSINLMLLLRDGRLLVAGQDASFLRPNSNNNTTYNLYERSGSNFVLQDTGSLPEHSCRIFEFQHEASDPILFAVLTKTNVRNLHLWGRASASRIRCLSVLSVAVALALEKNRPSFHLLEFPDGEFAVAPHKKSAWTAYKCKTHTSLSLTCTTSLAKRLYQSCNPGSELLPGRLRTILPNELCDACFRCYDALRTKDANQ